MSSIFSLRRPSKLKERSGVISYHDPHRVINLTDPLLDNSIISMLYLPIMTAELTSNAETTISTIVLRIAFGKIVDPILDAQLERQIDALRDKLILTPEGGWGSEDGRLSSNRRHLLELADDNPRLVIRLFGVNDEAVKPSELPKGERLVVLHHALAVEQMHLRTSIFEHDSGIPGLLAVVGEVGIYDLREQLGIISSAIELMEQSVTPAPAIE